MKPSPSDEPCAELWIGAHPDDPSVLSDGTPLDAAIVADPETLLGPAVLEKFGPRLPFLMKVLAADKPLSLQAHPTQAQARHGFAAEEKAGIPDDDPGRTWSTATTATSSTTPRTRFVRTGSGAGPSIAHTGKRTCGHDTS